MITNKIALITGAGQGIGRGIALALAKNGCQVIIADINFDAAQDTASQISPLGVKSLAIKCDISQKDEVDNMATTINQEFKSVDILVNNAGIYPFQPFVDLTEPDWDRVIDVNLKGNFLTTQALLKIMNDGGRIINISSVTSLIGMASLSHYCASKAAINGLTRALAIELAPRNITVNSIAPGAIDTQNETVSQEAKQKIIPLIPLRRMGTPQEVAALVVFLASADAGYITGQAIPIDGGWTAQ